MSPFVLTLLSFHVTLVDILRLSGKGLKTLSVMAILD